MTTRDDERFAGVDDEVLEAEADLAGASTFAAGVEEIAVTLLPLVPGTGGMTIALSATFFAGAFFATFFATFLAGAFFATFLATFLAATFFAGAFLATFFAALFFAAAFLAGAFLATFFAVFFTATV